MSELSNESFSHEKKKRLAEKISKLKRKEDMVRITEIIYEDNKEITENQNGIFMMFHKLKPKTYQRIEEYIESLSKKSCDEYITSSESNVFDKKEFVSYSKTDFPGQENLVSKLKYSNKEKNMIKRQRYGEIVRDIIEGKNAN